MLKYFVLKLEKNDKAAKYTVSFMLNTLSQCLHRRSLTNFSISNDKCLETTLYRHFYKI